MRPPCCSTRAKVSPGLIDRPDPRRSSVAVTKEKTKKQQAAALKAKELRRRTAQVVEVEREARKAREEVQVVSRGGKAAKKNFPRPNGNVTVSPLDHEVTKFLIDPPCQPSISPSPTTDTTQATKRNVNSARLSEPRPLKKPKATKYVPSQPPLYLIG